MELNVIIIKTMVQLQIRQTYVTLADLWLSCVGPLVFMLPKNLELFVFPII